ncbi:arsenic metallochaperone ArsD family protein [Lactococcus garvieae]|uniref:Arsenical resistance operon trans-acting repressor ArsD n=1 Tax=Lactococcus garvieae DCC43 TaxID=1231377 RepID=K2PPI3_9LACT|nr:arsenic metallochaperone ArsD family protein [Lactococcus garvieae]EKF52184.1 Arsenical resistance operon trans-acting repressor ArsD [Lactococcus garvieae DCC43]
MRLEIFEEYPDGGTAAIAQVFAAFGDEEEDAQLQTARYNLKESPELFANHPIVSEAMKKMECALPLTLVDGEIMLIGDYPDMEDLTEITGVSFQEIRNKNCQCNNCKCGKG